MRSNLLSICLTVFLGFGLMACAPFSDQYGNGEVSAGSATEGNQLPLPSGSAEFAADKTVCEAIAAVKVSIDQKLEVSKDEGWFAGAEGEKVSVKSEKLGDYTVSITYEKIIDDKTQKLNMVLKRTAGDKVDLCAMDLDGQKVKEGTITIAKFMDGKALAEAITAGSAKLTFEGAEASVTPAKLMSLLIKAEAPVTDQPATEEEKADVSAKDATAGVVIEGKFLAKGMEEKK